MVDKNDDFCLGLIDNLLQNYDLAENFQENLMVIGECIKGSTSNSQKAIEVMVKYIT